MVIVWCDRCDQQPCDIITSLVIELSTWQKYHSFPTCKREWIDKTQQWQESESYVATVNVDIDELLQVCSDFSTYSNISWYTKTFSCFFFIGTKYRRLYKLEQQDGSYDRGESGMSVFSTCAHEEAWSRLYRCCGISNRWNCKCPLTDVVLHLCCWNFYKGRGMFILKYICIYCRCLIFF